MSGQHSQDRRSGEVVTFAGGIDSTCRTVSISEAGGCTSPQYLSLSVVCGLRRFEIQEFILLNELRIVE